MICNTESFTTASGLFNSWQEGIESGKSPLAYPVATQGTLTTLRVGPESVLLIGGCPGEGKTAFVMQVVMDALRLTPTLKVVVCNVEMSPQVLLDRQLSRLSGIPLDMIRDRAIPEEDEYRERLADGLGDLKTVADRLAFVNPPYTLKSIAVAADEFQADMVVCDYIQRIPTGESSLPDGNQGSQRQSIDNTMSYIRQFADQGMAVIAVSAVSRSKDKSGNSGYSNLSLASFRGSSELEYGADSAYILARDKGVDTVTLHHFKDRHGECRDIQLNFDRPYQRFEAVDDPWQGLTP